MNAESPLYASEIEAGLCYKIAHRTTVRSRFQHYVETSIVRIHSKENGVNGHQLFGSRKGKSTYDALVTVRVVYDMVRAQRDYLISIFNDLKGCYDRVRPSLKTLTTRRIGLPKTVAVCHAAALRKMRHYLRTGFGISEKYLEGGCGK